MIIIRYLTSRRQKKRLKKFGDPELLKALTPGVSKWRPGIKFTLLLLALAALIFMLARPQIGSKISHEKRSGIETIICLDISNSMLAEDVAPSRLQKAKMLVENLVDQFTNDKIGLIVFAGDAFTQLPITTDYVSAKMFLQNISPSMIKNQGTNIAEALNIATKSFTSQENIGKAIIVITDGEDHEGNAETIAANAKKQGMNVYMLGIGSTQGTPIPDGNGGYMKDRAGQTVMSALNEQMCKSIAAAGNGAYIHVDNTNSAQKLLDNELSKLSKQEMQTTIYSEYDEQFQAFGILAILLLIIEILILEIKNPITSKMSLFKRKNKTAAVVVMLLIASAAQAQTDRQFITQGNRLYRQGKFAEAEVMYRKAAEKNPRNPQASFNLGNALLMQKKDSAAMVQWQQTAKLEPNKIRLAKSFHNMGVVLQSSQMYQEACTAYEEALRNNPKDDETRYNYVLCKHLLKNQKNNGGGGNNNQDQNKDKNKDQNKNQNQDQNKDQNKDKQDQDKNKDKQDQNKQQQQPQPNQMSRENAEQLLKAAEQQEQNTQRKLKEAQSAGGKRQYEKNW